MQNKRIFVNLHTPRVEANKVFLSWDQSPIFEESSYWIEYKGLKGLHCRPDALLEAYLPICIALSFLRNVTIKLPGYVDPLVLETWKKVCTDTTGVLCKKTTAVEFIVPDLAQEYLSDNENRKETALLFGGGSESLLTLAYLLDKKISPYLASLWGDGWIGSDLKTNPERFDLEEELCREFGLKIIRIHTNVRSIFAKKRFKPYLRQKVYLIDAAFSLPIYASVLLPVVEQFNIGTIVSGIEKSLRMGAQHYSLSCEMTRNIHSLSKSVKYYPYLENLMKPDVLKELHKKYPSIAKYQYSCYSATNKRWCLNCEKCFRNYCIFKIFDIDPITVGMDELEILRNLKSIIRIVRKKIGRDEVLFKTWERIREEATRKEKKEIIKSINLFYRKIFLREIIFFLKRWSGGFYV
jgi:hypothetical protein